MTQSLWLATSESVSLSSLTSSITCDVCIIGGGLTGLYTAYTLAKAGVDVVLLEANTHVVQYNWSFNRKINSTA